MSSSNSTACYLFELNEFLQKRFRSGHNSFWSKKPRLCMHSFNVNLYWVEAYVKCSVLSSFMRGEAVLWRAKRACAHPRMYADFRWQRLLSSISLFVNTPSLWLCFGVFCGMVRVPLLVYSVVCVYSDLCFNFMMFSSFYYSCFCLFVFFCGVRSQFLSVLVFCLALLFC